MGWFSAEYSWKDAKEPHEVRVYLKDGTAYVEEFYEDLVYTPAKMAVIDLDFGKTARHRAINYAYGAIHRGLYVKCEHEGKPHSDELHPPHKIDKVEVVRCKYEIVPTDDKKLVKVEDEQE